MPFSTSQRPPAEPAQALVDTRLQQNTLILTVGVTNYTHFPARPVRSATTNAIAWLLQGLRMRARAAAYPMLVSEGVRQRDVLMDKLEDLLQLASLSACERDGVSALVADLRGDSDGFSFLEPDAHSLQHVLFHLGMNLAGNPKARALVTFSGHGVRDRGHFALCPQDARPVEGDAASRAADLEARRVAARERFQAKLTDTRIPERYRYADVEGALRVFDAGIRQAKARDVLAEWMDAQEMLLQFCGPQPLVSMTQTYLKNLRRLPSQRGLPEAAYQGVISHVHLMIYLGTTSRRVTLILDACQSGGDGGQLQGATSSHGWLDQGLECRILSSSMGAQLSAEARIGNERVSAATWALTHVLSRWEPIDDRDGYAFSIRNGELVMRANMLLQALSFNQHLSLHAPTSANPRHPRAADMPFCGLAINTATTVEPEGEAGEIQLSSDHDTLTGWVVKDSAGVVKAVWVAVGPDATPWTHKNGTQFKRGRLTVLFNNSTAADLAASSSFTLAKFVRSGSNPVPPPLVSAIGVFNADDATEMPEVDDTLEQELDSAETLSKVFQYKKPGRDTVHIVWHGPTGGQPGKMGFFKEGAFPFTPADFGPGELTFTAQNNVMFKQGDWKRIIGYRQTYPWPT